MVQVYSLVCSYDLYLFQHLLATCNPWVFYWCVKHKVLYSVSINIEATIGCRFSLQVFNVRSIWYQCFIFKQIHVDSVLVVLYKKVVGIGIGVLSFSFSARPKGLTHCIGYLYAHIHDQRSQALSYFIASLSKVTSSCWSFHLFTCYNQRLSLQACACGHV